MTPIDPVYLGDPTLNAGELDMLARHNDTRIGLGLAPLVTSTSLCQIAQGQANYMAEEGEISHEDAQGGTVGDRATAAGYAYVWVAENTGYDLESAELYDGWLASAGHRANIVNPQATEIGLGRAIRGVYQYWCVVLGDR